MKIKAAVCNALNDPFQVQEIDMRDHPNNDEIRVRLVSSGICNTDVHAHHTGMQDLGFNDPMPMIFGHEGAGYVEEVGPNVTDFAVGDKVILSYPWCGECEWCKAGKPWNCPEYVPFLHEGVLKDGKAPFSRNGEPVHIFFGQSSFANNTITTVTNAVKVDCSDEALPYLAPFGCGVITGAGAVIGQFNAQPGSSIAIFGAGGVGLSALMAAKIRGCALRIVVDVNDERLKIAQELGATHVFNTKANPDLDIIKEIRDLTSGKGVNYSVETTSLPEIVRTCLAVLATEGEMSEIGTTMEITLPAFYFDLWGKTIKINSMGNVHPRTFIPQLVEWYNAGLLPVEKMEKVYTMEQINQAMEDQDTGRTIKPIIMY